jgi:hypothetical protein
MKGSAVSEHVQKYHPLGGIIMVLIISALMTWGISLMNDGNIATCAVGGVLLVGFGSYAVLRLGKE